MEKKLYLIKVVVFTMILKNEIVIPRGKDEYLEVR